MKKIFQLLSCILLLSTYSCQNDDNTSTADPGSDPVVVNFSENFGSQVTARFLGSIVDEQNNPISGATVRVGNTMATTDAFGTFSISQADAFEKFAYITAEKNGYIKGSRALVPSISEVNRIKIMLLKEDVIATINSGENTTVNLANGTEVTFDGNFVNANGAAHSGEVKVILKHLNPEDENMTSMMPGMLFAQNASGDAVTLETYGMLAVELRSNAGDELQLAEGSTSQIKMPLASNTSNPPNTIPLWHFDEAEGYWIEEGEATLQGNMYVGEVSHFSFWNYDYPYPSINLCITLQDEAGLPMPYTQLHLYSSLLNAVGTYGYTNANGAECGVVPEGEELTLTVYNTGCSEPFTTTIGPFTSDASIIVTVTAQHATTFTGTFLTCDGDEVTDGYVQLYINGQSQIIPVTDGTIDYSVSYCQNTAYSIKGIDVANNQVTEVVTGTLDGSATIDLGNISACTGFADSDGDGVFDTLEDVNGDNNLENDDTDEDGTPNYLDTDDDGDGIATADEDYDGDNDPTNDDTDGDGTPDYLDEVDVIIFDSEIPGNGCDPIVYDLNQAINWFSNGETNPNMSYVFYETETDAVDEENPLDPTYTIALADYMDGMTVFVKGTNTITGQTAVAMIYLYREFLDSDQDGLTDCEETTGVDDPATIAVPDGITDPNDPNDPGATYPMTGELVVCGESGFGIFDLNSMDAYFSQGGLPGTVTVTYHETEQDANAGVNALVSPYASIVIGSFTIYVRITSPNGVVQISTLNCTTYDIPSTVNGIVLTQCDGNGDGTATFTFTDATAQIVGSNANLSVSYFLTQADADNNTAPIQDPFVNTESPQTIFYRVEDINTGCFNVGTLLLEVDPSC